MTNKTLYVVIFNKEDDHVIFPSKRITDEFYTDDSIQNIIRILKTTGKEVVALQYNTHIASELSGLSIDHNLIVVNMSYGLQGQSRYTHLPALCESQGIPYTGNTVLTHSLCLDKVITKNIAAANNIKTPLFTIFTPERIDEAFLFISNHPDKRFIVKPIDEAASIGLHELSGIDEFEKILPELKDRMLIEEKIIGDEVHAPFVKGMNLLPVKINLPQGSLYDQEIKANATSDLYGGIDDPRLRRDIRFTMTKIVSALKVEGYCRADFIVKGDEIYLLEVNSHASLKPSGAFLHSVNISGYSEDDFIDAVINTANK